MVLKKLQVHSIPKGLLLSAGNISCNCDSRMEFRGFHKFSCTAKRWRRAVTTHFVFDGGGCRYLGVIRRRTFVYLCRRLALLSYLKNCPWLQKVCTHEITNNPYLTVGACVPAFQSQARPTVATGCVGFPLALWPRPSATSYLLPAEAVACGGICRCRAWWVKYTWTERVDHLLCSEFCLSSH